MDERSPNAPEGRASARFTASLALAACVVGCSASAQVEPAPAGRAASTSAPTSASPSVASRVVAAGVATRLPFVVEPMPGSRAALVVASTAEVPGAFARRVDESGALGPLMVFPRARVLTAFDGADGATTFVTSDGADLCVDTFDAGATTPRAHGCGETSAALAVPVAGAAGGDALERVALLEPEVHRPVSAGSGHAAPARPTPKAARHAHVPKDAKKHRVAPRKQPKSEVSLRVRFASRDGVFDDEARASGLTFTQPEEGLRLVDAKARAGGVDVAWFEPAPERKTRSPLGSARLTAGHLGADGVFDRASRLPVTDGDLEYGFVQERKAPRLATTAGASVLVALDKKLECNAWRAQPKVARFAVDPIVCALDPGAVARADALDASALAALHAIAALDPRRAPGQPKTDPGLVAWAGDRAVFQRSGALWTATRAAGDAREARHPFEARRARVAWAAFAPDGEGVALVDGAIVHVDASGAASSRAADAAASLRALEASPARPARLGDAWWIAVRQGVRVFPAAGAGDLGDGADAADASALVGGAVGLLIEVSGEGTVRGAPVSPTGAAAASPFHASPVRVGFGAAPRAHGGAIVAGASVADAGRVRAFTLDAAGAPGPAFDLPMTSVHAGDFRVRAAALPNGGALVWDEARTEVAWLDDDARPLAAAPWPRDAADGARPCPADRAPRASVPTPTPGVFVRVPELVEPGVCLASEPTWARDGSLRAFVTRARGLDVTAEVVVVKPSFDVAAPPALATASVAAAADTSPSPACPLDMVLVARRLCVDRFEDALVDAATLEPLSPDWPTTPSLAELALAEWSTGRERTGDVHARAMPLPIVPASWPRGEPMAVSRFGARASGYVSGVVAERACAAAGKRLCSLDEFVLACRGEEDTLFPYGDDYRDGVCNVNRDEHPAATLHDNAAIGHLDPRLDRVTARGARLYQSTGASPGCRSRWGADAAYDLVGNLDEWIDHGAGAFAGGFYSRATKSGCEALVASHPRPYLDYSTGVRCCKDAASGAARTP